MSNSIDIKVTAVVDSTSLLNGMDEIKNAVNNSINGMNTSLMNMGNSVNTIGKAFTQFQSSVTENFKFLSNNALINSNSVNSSILGINNSLGSLQGKSIFDPLIQSIEDFGSQLDNLKSTTESGTEVQSAFYEGLDKIATAVTVVSGVTAIAESATAAFSGSVAASPIGGYVAIIGTAITALLMIGDALSNEKTEHDKTIESLKNEIIARDELHAKQAEKLNADLSEIDHIREINIELGTLVDSNGKVKDGYEARAKVIMNELNEAFGLNMEMIDKEIIGYDDIKSSIDNLIEKKRAEVILEAELPRYKEAIMNVTTQQIEVTKLESQMIDDNNRKTQLKNEIDETYGTNWLNRTEMIRDKRYQEWEDLNYDVSKNQETLDIKREKLNGYYNDISSYDTNSLLITSGNAENYRKVQFENATAVDQSVSQIKMGIEDKIKGENDYIDYLKGQVLRETDQTLKDILQSQIETKELSIENKRKEIDGLTEMVKEKTPAYDLEVKNLSMVTLASFKGDTEKYFSVSQGKFDKMIDGLKSKDPEVRLKAEESAKKMMEGLESKKDKYSKAGCDILDGLINGSNSRIGNACAQMGIYGNSMLTTFKNSLGIKSPSKKFADIAKFIPDGISKGIKDNEGVALSTVENLSDNLVNAFDNDGISNLYNSMFGALSNSQINISRNGYLMSILELSKLSKQNQYNENLTAKLTGVIENHISIEGREAAIALTPFISEEIAFQGGL